MSAADGLEERLSFMEFTLKQRRGLRSLKPTIDKVLGSALNGVFRQLRATTATSKLFVDEIQWNGLEALQKRHWEVLATGEYAESYISDSSRISGTYGRIGLSPRWYIGGCALVLEKLVSKLVRKMSPSSSIRKPWQSVSLPDAISALIKAALLDIDNSVSGFLDKAEADQAIAVARMRHAIEKLAERDLTFRLTGMPKGYESLEGAYDAAIQRLHAQACSTDGSFKGGGISAARKRGFRPTVSMVGLANEQDYIKDHPAEMRPITVDPDLSYVRCSSTNATPTDTRKNEGGTTGEVKAPPYDLCLASGDLAFRTNLMVLESCLAAGGRTYGRVGFASAADHARDLAQRTFTIEANLATLVQTPVDRAFAHGRGTVGALQYCSVANGLAPASYSPVDEIHAAIEKQCVAVGQVLRATAPAQPGGVPAQAAKSNAA